MAKAGRPKAIRPQDIALQLPKHPKKYQAKRLYWAILQLEKRMARDITSVKMSEYRDALNAYIVVVEELEKKGIKYGYNKKTRSGMVESGVVQDESDRVTAGNSQDGSVSVGAGVPPPDPFA